MPARAEPVAVTSLLARIRAANVDRGPDGAITVAELTLAVLVVFVALAGWASLALATAGEFRGLTLLLTMALAVVAMVVVARTVPPPPIVFDRGDLVVLGAAVLAAVFFLPGSEYLFADKDPGAYSTHAFAIARTGSTEIPDPVGQRLPGMFGVGNGLGGRFPGYWYAPNDNAASIPQFFHMFPSLLAAAKVTFGGGAVLQLPPVLGVVSVATFTAAARRVFGLPVAALAGVLLATNMLGVFFAKYPSTETFAQLLYGGAALLAITALRTRWAPAATGAGLLLTLAFSNRPDGVLLLLLGVGALALGIAVRLDRRLLIGGAIGLALPLASVWWQAYERNARYAGANGVPGGRVVAALIVITIVGGFVIRRWAPHLLSALAPRAPRHWRVIAVGSLLVVGAWLTFSGLRSRLLGAHIQYAEGRPPLATLDEINLQRLFWFFSPAGLVLFWIGVTVALVVHRRAATWLLLGPGLALLPVYIWRARISPRVMWWGRRFVPTAVPIVVLIIAVAIVWLIVRRGRYERLGQSVAAAALAVVLGVQLFQSTPLLGFREFEGTDSFLTQVDALADDDDAVFLWEESMVITDPSRNAAGPMWFVHDRPSAVLGRDPTQAQLDQVAAAFDGHRVIVLTHTAELPGGFDAARLQPIGIVAADIHQWAEAFEERPATANVWPMAMAAWELTPG